MKKIIVILMAMLFASVINAEYFNYKFNSTRLSEALSRIAEENPSLNLNFIYNELDSYFTSARINTDDIFDALRNIVGLNPVSVIKKGDRYYVEALQHGKYVYSGRVIGADNQPVIAATVLILEPKDSTVLTFGITDDAGHFLIPCDRQEVIGKISCVGYATTYSKFNSFNVGRIQMVELPVALKAVTVKAQNARLYADKSVYIPTNRQKNASQNAIDLLRQMSIPQIRINPVSDAVTDNSGSQVAIFINFLAASNEELEGLRTQDVKRVEYLEFPTDPRYHGAERVINIIVQEYAYGGYTKVTANENFFIGLSSRVNIFSKFSYKKMTYDLYAGANNWNNHHIGNTTEGIYRLKDNDGKEYSLTRRETLESSHYKQNQYPLTFRATYSDEKIQIRNLVGFTNLGIPTNEYSGTLEYSPMTVKECAFESKNPNRSNAIAYAGTYFIVLPKNFSVDFSPSFNYTHRNDYTNYSVSNQPTIYRHAKENAYNYRLNLFIRKSIGQKHSIMLGGNGGDNINRLIYTGDNEYRDKFHIAFAAAMAGYNFQTQKLSVNLDAGIGWENSDINRQKNSDTYPFTHIYLKFVPNQKNSFSAYLQYATNSPGISEKSSDVLRENEVMYITGNPLLKNCRHTTANFAYTWIPSNVFGMSAYGRYYGIYDRQIIVYSPYDDGKALLRSNINDGNYFNGEIGLAFNWKLIDGKLQFYANPSQSFFKSTGIFKKTYNSFRMTAQVSYYLESLYFQAYYESPEKSMFSTSPQINEGSNYHSVSVGWGNANWNLRISAVNFFNKGWNGATNITFSPYYSNRQTLIGTSSHSRINFTATYTFGYGKKVQRGNEVSEQSGAASAILK